MILYLSLIVIGVCVVANVPGACEGHMMSLVSLVFCSACFGIVAMFTLNQRRKR
jgi:hypothetical protein